MALTDPNTDVALIVDRLLPNARYRGAGRGQDGYDRLVATWLDPRPFPTEPQVDAEQIVFLAENPRDELVTKRLDSDLFFKFIFQVNFELENRLRAQAVPPEPVLTEAQYRRKLIDIFRAIPGTI